MEETSGRSLVATRGSGRATSGGRFPKTTRKTSFASDVSLSYSDPRGKRDISPGSQAFTDVLSWRWKDKFAIRTITAYDPWVYPIKSTAPPALRSITGIGRNRPCICWPRVDRFHRIRIQRQPRSAVESLGALKDVGVGYLADSRRRGNALATDNLLERRQWTPFMGLSHRDRRR